MSRKIIVLILLMCNGLHGQNAMEGLRGDDTRLAIGANFPAFGIMTSLYNVQNKWGGYISVLLDGGSGIEDENAVTSFHELTDDYLVNNRGGTVGLTYRLLKPLHVYGGIGVGWATRQLIYQDTPPVVLEDAYRLVVDGIKPSFGFGVHLSLWRVAIGAGYNTFIKGPEFFIGYVIKIKSNN